MSKELTKENVIQNKKAAIKALNNLLELYINDPSEKHLKKANLISYWLKDYVNLINFEEKFDPTRNISYKRGDIVKLNFGFNVGSEYGGLHYGIVLDNKNAHHSPVVTVIPLTSVKEEKSIHNNSVELGNEIYRLLKVKYDTILKTLKDEQSEITNAISLFTILVSSAETFYDDSKKYESGTDIHLQQLLVAKDYLTSASELKNSFLEKQAHNVAEQAYLQKIGDEISKMKEGSIALVNQITTVSKMRIFDPRNLKGVLSGISLSAESMEKINQKVKDLYVF